ncbi:MAG: chromate transporter [Chthonomonadaceae bacterium]|nr:chromate transporter [Chthonomonadaceae bacterium]
MEMGRVFLVIGALAFGGQGGLLALLSRDLAEGRGWVEEAEIAEAFTYVQLLPGAVVVQVVAYLGYRLRGWRGAAIATTAFLLPSVAAMLALAAVYRRVAVVTGVPAALHGLTSAVVGLIALAAYKQGRKTIKDAVGVCIAVTVLAASVWTHVNPAVLVVTAGGIGLLREATRKKDMSAEDPEGGRSGQAAP